MDGTSAVARRLDEQQQTYRFEYHGDGTAFFLLVLKNVLLTVVTLGIYAAWAKAERRRYMWANVEFHGQRLAFTGTGSELFKGYLKVGAAYLLFFVVPALLGRVLGSAAETAVRLFSIAALAFLVPFAIYRSRAYLLSRTRWRGIRFGMAGKTWPYVRAFIGTTLLTILTLGLYAPWASCRMRAIMTNDTRFGSEAFSYDGKGRELFPIWIKGVILGVLTLGIYWFWMAAAIQRYHFDHTRIGGARVRFDLTGGKLFKIAVVQTIGVTLTLGIAFPWIVTWAIRETLAELSLDGVLDFAAIEQRHGEESATGEGFADALDVGLGV